MKNLSPQAKMKLAILLKNKEKTEGVSPLGSHPEKTISPNLAPPPVSNNIQLAPKPFNPFSQGDKIESPGFFNLKKKLRGF